MVVLWKTLLTTGCFLLLTTTYISLSEACSCQPTHPQQQFCQADFVILARIKRAKTVNQTTEYKIRIRKEYKMSEKSVVALKYGRVLTHSDENVCGIHLDVGEVYALTGRVHALQAHITLCEFAEKWTDLTKRQRKGLKLMYRQGCTCKIKNCLPYRRCTRTRDECNWETKQRTKELDCQRNEGICLRSASKQCYWSKSATLTACMKNFTTLQPNYPPKSKLMMLQRKYSPFHDGPGKKFGQ